MILDRRDTGLIILLACMLYGYAGELAAQGAGAEEKSGPTAAEYGVVLNLSGKQRMLTQKMSKEVLLVALDCDKAGNLENLETTAALFERTLEGLRNGDAGLGLPPTTARRITRQLDKTKELWVPFYEQIQVVTKNAAASDADVKVVAESNVPLLKEMNRCVKLYEQDASKAGLKSDPALAVTINLSGKQRMLTQKMSKEYLLVAYGYQAEDNRLSLRETSTLFERTLNGLRDGDATLELQGTKPPHILDQLSVVESLWVEFKTTVEFAMDDGKASIPMPEITGLAGKNLPLLKEMNKAVKMYEKQAAK